MKGLGTELRCPLIDQGGNANPWYELVGQVKPGDIVFHWHAKQSALVGKSIVAALPKVERGWRVVRLRNFTPIDKLVRLDDLRAVEPDIRRHRDRLSKRFPDCESYYLPFQYRSDGLRMMSNYFAKMPRGLVKLLGLEGSAANGGVSAAEPAIPGGKASRMQFLEPFRPKSDAKYIAQVAPRTEQRSRAHETLVNAFANWLSAKGFEPARNQAVDLGLSKPSVIFEAKTIGARWAGAIRAAVGQLYEYRYFSVVSSSAGLVFLAPKVIPNEWLSYLEDDRKIGCVWFDGVTFKLSPLAKRFLGLRGTTA